MLTDEQTMASAQMMDGDMQVNQAAYNYNAWYQVRVVFSSCCTRLDVCKLLFSWGLLFICGQVSVVKERLE